MNIRRCTIGLAVASALALAASCTCAAPAAPLTSWPHLKSAIAPDAKVEARVREIVGKMTLAQKIGQMTQAELKAVTPDDVRKYYLGSVLNGGGGWPHNDKHARAADWLKLADAFYDASMATDMAIRVPVIWGTDAVHGHNNVYGATIFPHNIGLGAARDPELVKAIGAATGKAVRATGIAWVFGPTVAVVRDDRWGRTYEGFSEDPRIVRRLAGPYVQGLQGMLKDDVNVIASIKHFMGDGGTGFGINMGVTKASEREMMNIHAQGYYSGIEAGAQTVMASFNAWNDVAAGRDHGRVHGSHYILTEILKEKMGFDGFVVSDWNGIADVPGCRKDSCAQAINAGIDMVMVPNDWKAFIANTIGDVEAGRIPLARIDDAVTRIVRVKLRAGVFDKRPSQSAWAGKDDALLAKELGRRAVRESLVLLKNEGPALPLAARRRLLVVGKAADDMASQTGGWALTWQGTANTNADFPNGETILAGLKAAGADVTYSADAAGVDPGKFDAIVAVIGEAPYAEGDGDIRSPGTLRHSSRYPEDLAVLRKVHGKGKPVVTVFLSGRPLWVNDLLNLSDTFIAAWLPGTEGKGVSDLLVAGNGAKPYEFTGRLSYSWPTSVCQTPLNVGDRGYAPLFAYGYGLRRGERSHLGRLDDTYPAGGCGTSDTYPVHGPADRASFPLRIRSGTNVQALGADLNATTRLPGITVAIAQIRAQQDAKLVTWTGPATFEAHGRKPLALPAALADKGLLRFDTIVQAAPAGKVSIAVGSAALDATRLFTRLTNKGAQSVAIPLACFRARGAQATATDTPFSIMSDGPFAAAFGAVDVTATAPNAVACEELR
ncbi:MAG: glycoside hydrolase family 3 C-terminal domain-containing protein [Massilia sp.]|nr:glycoside hydrolase family 3 C-terminal domain-containing protein [Massilia sp.]